MYQHVTELQQQRGNSGHLQGGRIGGLYFTVTTFLDRCYQPSILGEELFAILEAGATRGESRLDRLVAACGFADDAPGFFAELVLRVESGAITDWRTVTINGAAMPHALLMAVLETIEPGDQLIDITSVQQLEDLIRRPVKNADRGPLQEVLDRFPVRLSQHSLRQLRLSSAVGCQYLPFIDELSHDGLVNTWVGQFHSGVIERMYHNRVIMVLNMSCPVYCRFCFRKHKECRQEPSPTRADVLQGIEYVRSCPEITEVVLTGGDPFMNRATLTTAAEGLLEVENVRILRLATRSMSYHPALFTQKDGFWLKYLKDLQAEASRRGKRIEIATHFIHPDELSLRSLDLIADLVSSGITVYVQTPLLGGTNDSGVELVELYQRLRAAGAEMHYVFMPCSPLQGNRAYQSTIDDGIRLAAYLRAHLSDRAMPHFCTATAFGKIDWGSNGWAVEEDQEDPRFLWLRTPYTEQTFGSFTTGLNLSGVARHNSEGTLDARFMVEVGDRRWRRGTRSVTTNSSVQAHPDTADIETRLASFAALESGVEASCDGETLRRVHRTRVEINCASIDGDVATVIDKLARLEGVSDVVIWSSGLDPLCQPQVLAHIIEGLAALPRISAVRVRSREAVIAPENLSHRVLEVLTSANRLSAVAPLRVELELRILHESELTKMHGDLTKRLRSYGVTVYSNTLLLAGINANPESVRGISSACRLYGIEFHNLVVAGNPAQELWNVHRPIDVSQVVDISSTLRRVGSGRELPRYVVQTTLGEVDFGLSAEPVGIDDAGHARLRLLPFTVDELGDVKPWGRRPSGAEIDEHGHLVVSVPGLTC